MSTFLDPPTMEEKKRIIAEAAKPTTFRNLARITDPEGPIAGGRFAESETVIAGEADCVGYPRQPDASPWSGGGAQVPPEESLGFSVEDVPVCAEPWEVEKAARILAEREAQSAPPVLPMCDPVGTEAPATPGSSPVSPAPPSGAVEFAGANHIQIKRRRFLA